MSALRLLWTVANWKRTGPVEPSLDLAAAMARRGHEVQVAVGLEPPGREQGVAPEVTARGLKLLASAAHLRKHAAPLRNWLDVRALRSALERERIDACVCTLRNDHHLAVRAAGERPVVRLDFGEGQAAIPGREQRALRRSQGILVFGKAMESRLLQLGVAPQRIARVGPPLDLAGLRARVTLSRHAVRERWKVAPGVLLVGIVARMQRHRHFEWLWDALDALRGEAVHLLVIGRGTHEEDVARRPVRERALSDCVTFAGYLTGADYASTVAALDLQLLLVPGSDPTCRALREGQALGVPSLVVRRGLLPEYVPESVGRVVGESADEVAAGLRAFLAMGEQRVVLARAAQQHAELHYDPARAAQALERLLGAAS